LVQQTICFLMIRQHLPNETMKCRSVVHVNKVAHLVDDNCSNTGIRDLNESLIEGNHAAGTATPPATLHAPQAQLAEPQAFEAQDWHCFANHHAKEVFGLVALPLTYSNSVL
jgi:hypothetical protein